MSRDDHQRGAPKGFALLEVMIALGILALIITTGLAIFFDRQKRLLMASEMIIASQGLANEAELLKRRNYGSFIPGRTEPFVSLVRTDPAEEFLVDALPNLRHETVASQAAPGVLAIRMTLHWGKNNPQRTASLTILKSGARLW